MDRATRVPDGPQVYQGVLSLDAEAAIARDGSWRAAVSALCTLSARPSQAGGEGTAAGKDSEKGSADGGMPLETSPENSRLTA